MTRAAQVLFVAAAAAVAGPEAGAENWPQWRGPQLNGISTASGLPATWSATENVVWKTPLPSWSAATPIVWEDRIFIVSPTESAAASQPTPTPTPAPAAQQGERGARGGGRGGGRGGRPARDPGGETIQLHCLDRATGAILWSREIGGENALGNFGNASSPSPVTDGKSVWTLTGRGELRAFDFEGTQLWRRNLQEDYGTFGVNFIYSSSPLLLEDRLIIGVLHGMRTDDPSYMLAVNKATGDVIWKTERPTNAQRESPDSYTTPVLFEQGGRQLALMNGGDVVTAHDVLTGEEVWRLDGLNPGNAPNYRIVASITSYDDLVIAPTRIRPMLAIRPAMEGEELSATRVWESQEGPDVPTPVTDGQYVWIAADGGGVFRCLDASTGEKLNEVRVEEGAGTCRSSLLLADGKLFAIMDDARAVVLEATPEMAVLGVNALDGSYTLSSIVGVDNQLFIRTGAALYCIAKGE